jgi:nucleotide-binding universal stress UspA family protein
MCGRHGESMQTLRHLVAGTDFSACAQRGLALAITLAVAARVRVTVVHVCELGIDDLDDRRLLQCAEALSEVVARHRRCGVEVAGVLRSGKAWEKLDNVAAEVGASLIVIGRCGAGRGRSVEIGSVADHLVRSASRPVLTVACDFNCLDAEAYETNQPCTRNKTS